MANGAVYIDCFSSLDDIPKRKRRDPDVLLAFFQKTGTRRVSTFEVDDKIMNAMNVLRDRGALKWSEDSVYPWHDFTLIEQPTPDTRG